MPSKKENGQNCCGFSRSRRGNAKSNSWRY